jgi:hypothetical protein
MQKLLLTQDTDFNAWPLSMLLATDQELPL